MKNSNMWMLILYVVIVAALLGNAVYLKKNPPEDDTEISAAEMDEIINAASDDEAIDDFFGDDDEDDIQMPTTVSTSDMLVDITETITSDENEEITTESTADISDTDDTSLAENEAESTESTDSTDPDKVKEGGKDKEGTEGKEDKEGKEGKDQKETDENGQEITTTYEGEGENPKESTKKTKKTKKTTAEGEDSQDKTTTEKASGETEDTTEKTKQKTTKKTTENSTQATTTTEITQMSDVVSMDDALFIGDSRTVGIQAYSNIKGADFFCNVGMSVYKVNTEEIEVGEFGKITLGKLLKKKKYGKIYIMLGINELGYDRTTTITKFTQLVKAVQKKQPDAIIFVEGNLHVTHNYALKNSVVNNKSINNYNKAIKELADDKKIFYININKVWDDEYGAFPPEMTGDGVHPKAQYYKQWGTWIINKTTEIYAEHGFEIK